MKWDYVMKKVFAIFTSRILYYYYVL